MLGSLDPRRSRRTKRLIVLRGFGKMDIAGWLVDSHVAASALARPINLLSSASNWGFAPRQTRPAYLEPYRESVAVHETQASSPSRNMIWTPFSSSRPSPPSPAAFIASHFLVSASSMLLATCMSMAQGAALSMAPMKPSGLYRLSLWATRVSLATSPGAAHGGS